MNGRRGLNAAVNVVAEGLNVCGLVGLEFQATLAAMATTVKPEFAILNPV